MVWLVLAAHAVDRIASRLNAPIVQAHEWGGTFKNLVMHAHFRRFRPGLRMVVNLFGGHYWRTQVKTHAALTGHAPCIPKPLMIHTSPASLLDVPSCAQAHAFAKLSSLATDATPCVAHQASQKTTAS